MIVMIDSANLEEIKYLFNYFPYDGVTTNPSILKKENRNPFEQLNDIKNIIPKDTMLHCQVLSKNADEMVKEAEYIVEKLGKDTYIKVPVTEEGLKAISILSKKGINITATAIYTAMQGYMAAKAGAKFVAPYVNRLDNLGYDGVQVAKDIHTLLKNHNFDCKVVAASFKNSQQILELGKFGIEAITASFDVLRNLYIHPVTDKAVNDFCNDFEKIEDNHKTMLDY